MVLTVYLMSKLYSYFALDLASVSIITYNQMVKCYTVVKIQGLTSWEWTLVNEKQWNYITHIDVYFGSYFLYSIC